MQITLENPCLEGETLWRRSLAARNDDETRDGRVCRAGGVGIWDVKS